MRHLILSLLAAIPTITAYINMMLFVGLSASNKHYVVLLSFNLTVLIVCASSYKHTYNVISRFYKVLAKGLQEE